MKRDLKINYGKLDDIIGELQTYEEALETMEESLEEISTLVKTNEGKSIDAWDEQLNTSKGEVKKYQEQIGDLLSLFENYVSDTTAYISPISRKAMMRVSRNNIWANLQQMEIGVEGKIANALLSSLKEPSSFLFGLLEDPTDAEQDASDYNKRQLERIEDSIQSTQSVITEKMDDLWELYNDKVKPFENTDDSYKELASDVKDDYTGFFESIGEDLMDSIKDSFDLLRGFVSGAVDLVKGVAILASDAGIVLVSSQIPDPIEPAFIKDKNDEIVEDYSNAAKQVIDNPLIVAEMVAQSVSDTVEEEGAMFATGEALTALIPVAGGLKFAKEGAVLKNVGKGKSGKRNSEINTKISEADKAKLDKWDRAPDEGLYLKNKKTYDNPKYFDQETGDVKFPGTNGNKHTDGFINGEFKTEPLTPGTVIDRYGENGSGRYFSPVGSTYNSRALPPFMQGKTYEKYEVIREFEVKSGTVAPWFDEPGNGTQFFTDYQILDSKGRYVEANVENLIEYKYIKKLD